MKKIGIFAGAFDPIHDGHIDVARAARDSLGLDSVYLAVEQSPWSNKQPAEVTLRRRMVDIALDHQAGLEHIILSGVRFDIPHTLPELQAQFPDVALHFIMGADVFMRMDRAQWPGLDTLLQHTLIIFSRGDVTEGQIHAHAETIGTHVHVLESPRPHHSSTDVRINIHAKHVWVPAAVAQFIDDNGLYLS